MAVPRYDAACYIRKLVSAPEYGLHSGAPGVFELWSAPALGHSTHSTALTECVECLEYFYMSKSATGTYPIAILSTRVHRVACISKKYNSENDIYGCMASVENIVKPYLSVFINLVPPDK